MMNFFKGIKDRLSKDQSQPVYRQYTHGQLKIIAMRTRMIFQDLYKKQSLKITQADNQFKKVQSSQGTIHQQYQVLQQISKKVIQTQTIKLFLQILKKIQSYSPQIINTKGDVSLMKQQIKWFQCVLWYKRSKNLHSIDEFDKFCFNFFKGVDITMELNLKCELFKVYEGMQYLDENLIVPMDLAVEKIVPYVSFMIKQEELDEMKNINREEIRKKQEEDKKKMIEQNPFINLPMNQPNGNYLPINNIPNSIPNGNNPTSNYTHQQLLKPQPPLPINPNPYIHHPQPTQNNTKNYTHLPSHDQQFALDPYSQAHKLPPNPTSNKSFKSNDLNLVDWQAQYKKNQSQENPYTNNSKIGLINHDYSVSSQENSYDETTLPYPPSGVVSVDDIAKKDDFYIDTLPRYEPKPVESAIRFIKKQQNNGRSDDDSFLKGIQNQFFSTQENTYGTKCQNNTNTFNEEDLLNDIQQKKPQNKPEENSKPKSLNKLFGFKFKSSLDPVTTQPTSIPFGTNSQNYGQNNNNASLKSNNEIDDLLNNMTQNMQKQPEHKVESSDIDDILSELDNTWTQNHSINPPNRFSVDEMLRDIASNQTQYNKNSNGQSTPKDPQHLDEDIKSLIQSHRKQLKKESSKNSSENQYNRIEKQAQNDQTDFTPYQYPDDGQRFNDSKIKFSEEMELLDEFESRINQDDKKQSLQENEKHNSNPQLPQQVVQQSQKTASLNGQFDYGSLEKDLFDSLKIIKNHYGEQVPSHHQTKSNQKNPKKPYMVSIYARKQYMDGIKLTKHQSCQ